MREMIMYVLAGFFLNRIYNLVKREFWAWRRRKVCQRYLDIFFPKGIGYKPPPNYRCTSSIDKEIDRLVEEKKEEQENWQEGVTIQGLPLPEGAEDFDLKGFIIDPYTGEVTGNWTQ